MPATSSAPSSLRDYLKKYESVNEQEKKKKRKKKEKKTKPEASGVLVVDEDPVWQKPVNLEEESEQSADEDTPQVDEDIEVKRMRRLEQLREQRKNKPISEDGSGWVSLSADHAKAFNENADIYSASTKSARNDTPSPERQLEPFTTDVGETDLSPPRQRRRRLDSPPEQGADISHLPDTTSDLSPPRKRRTRNDTPSPRTEMKSSKSGRVDSDLSPPRRRQRDSSSARSPGTRRRPLLSESQDSDMSPPRKPKVLNDIPSPARDDVDMSPPRQRRRRNDSPSEGNIKKNHGVSDLSPPRRIRQSSPHQDYVHASMATDLSPPRKGRSRSIKDDTLHADLSPPRRKHDERSHQSSLKELPKTGLISGRDIREEIVKIKKDEHLRIQDMDPSMSGRGAEPVYRDKKGARISKEEYLKLKNKVEEKPKEKKIEWGKGLAQKREAEARLQELEMEKDKPFARTRDDPELDKMLKERLRWGDPMAHLVKKKHSEPVLPDLGESEKMIESGFMIPQDIPGHSWLKRGLDAAPNRYGIKPGRHWDGVDRSNGFEKGMFKKLNEKQATQREAYLWSVSDM